ncbi:MAG: PEFG-CTERM sorting domain-containing protein [Thaumarchaeota archaeon]|nr:PEFG-CTERM sorting domain-containing protein [Nitrososphaerota archaeon]
MEIRIFYGLISLLIISTGTVFAQVPLINVQTNNSNYNEGDIIVVSGNVTTIIGDTPVTLQLFIEGSLVDIAQITVAQDGSYSHTIIAEGQLWKKIGDYLIRVSYGEGNIAETEFSFTPKSELIKTTTIFEVNAGNYGTFDVEYTIKGGTIKDMIIDPNIFAIIVQIESTDRGTVSLDLPREFIGAEKQDGKDDTFIILIDGIEVAYQESVVHSDSRVITINFEEGDSDIEIIGTYVIPEFGTIAMIILIVGIMTIILTSRNKFQIKI